MDVSYTKKMALSFSSKYSRVAEQSRYDFLSSIESSTGQIDERSSAWIREQVQAKLVVDEL